MSSNSEAIIIGALVIAAGFAVISKPPRDAFAPEMARLVANETTRGIATAMGEPQFGAALAPVNRMFEEECRRATADCSGFFRGVLGLSEDDFFVARFTRVTNGEAGLYCVGAFDTWKCWFDNGEARKA
ncbi:MAG: hypothetical protein AAGM38_00220 [Pseudomonadota bacterium]